MPIECSVIPVPRSPLSQYNGDVHSDCSDCSICQELATPAGTVPPIYPSSSPKPPPLSAPPSSTVAKKANASPSMVNSEGRSSLQSPLVGKRSPTNGANGLPGGSSAVPPPTLPEIHIEEATVCHKPPVEPEVVKKKLSGKFKVKFSTTKTIQNEDTSSHSSHESTSASRKDNKRKKTDGKKSHSRGNSFDYRLFKDMFKISLPRSRSAGELVKTPEHGVTENGETCERMKKSKSKSKSKLLGTSEKRDSKVKVQKEDEEVPRGDGLVGLKNLGNTCFMNSIIQCLSHSALVRDYFLSRKYKSELSTSSKMQGRLAEEFASLLSDMWSGKHDTVSPNKFKSTVAKSAPRFVGYSQQDSQEFLRFFLEGLHEDLNSGRKGKRKIEEPPKGLNDCELGQHRWDDYVTYEKSQIVNMFVGLLKSTLTCSVCEHKSVTFDPFWDLSLPLPRTKGISLNLQSCFEEFTQEEILDADEKPTCEKCKKRQKCTKQFSIERYPPMLVIHLKRFSEVRYRSKLTTRVDFPIEELDLSPFASSSHSSAPMYDLVGVSNHSGNTSSGHYIAYCRTTPNRWHRFSDTSVGSLQRSDIVSSEAYVLFYERKAKR